MAAIVVVGSVNADMILRVERLPRPGETVLGREFSMTQGGKGANQAVAARRAGGDVSLIARVGDDPFGRQALDRLNAEKIDTRPIRQESPGTTGVALIFVDAHGENSIGVASGANAALSPLDVFSARQTIAGADVLLVQLETPVETVVSAVLLARENSVPVILNPAPACALPASLWSNVSILTPNRVEAETLSGTRVTDKESARLAAARLHEKGIKTVIITMGEEGVLASSAGEVFHLEAHPVNALDTTAAGDVFSGALAVALAEHRTLRDAVQFANAAAALCVTRLGAQPSIPHRSDIDAFLRQMEEQAVLKH